MGTLIECLMEEGWVLSHVTRCAEDNLSRMTVRETILPKIVQLVNDGCGEKDFVNKLAREFQRNPLPPDLQMALSCIESKVIYELEDHELPNVEGFMAHMSSSLLSKFFYLHCRKIGYISSFTV